MLCWITKTLNIHNSQWRNNLPFDNKNTDRRGKERQEPFFFGLSFLDDPAVNDAVMLLDGCVSASKKSYTF